MRECFLAVWTLLADKVHVWWNMFSGLSQSVFFLDCLDWCVHGVFMVLMVGKDWDIACRHFIFPRFWYFCLMLNWFQLYVLGRTWWRSNLSLVSGHVPSHAKRTSCLYRYVPCIRLEYYIHIWILCLTRLRKKSLRSWFSVVSISPTQDHSTSSTKNSPKTACAFAVDPFWKTPCLGGLVALRWIHWIPCIINHIYWVCHSKEGSFKGFLLWDGWDYATWPSKNEHREGILVVRFAGCFEVSTYGNWQSEEFVQAPRETLCMLFDKVNWQSLGQKTHI